MDFTSKPGPEKISVSTEILNKYLQTDNGAVRNSVGYITSVVQAAALRSIQTVTKERDRISDSTDYLDGVLSTELGISSIDEIREITTLAQELESFFDNIVARKAFPTLEDQLEKQLAEIEQREEELRNREAEIENLIKAAVDDAKAKAKLESTTSKGLFESAMQKAEKVVEQNKITRFVCMTISKFQDEFEQIQKERDVEYITKVFQATIEPFQITKMVHGKDGKLTKVIVNSFSESCYQDLFFFFYRYYNELMDSYEKNGELPSTADELGRIFKKKQRGAEQIIAEMHSRKS